MSARSIRLTAFILYGIALATIIAAQLVNGDGSDSYRSRTAGAMTGLCILTFLVAAALHVGSFILYKIEKAHGRRGFEVEPIARSTNADPSSNETEQRSPDSRSTTL